MSSVSIVSSTYTVSFDFPDAIGPETRQSSTSKRSLIGLSMDGRGIVSVNCVALPAILLTVDGASGTYQCTSINGVVPASNNDIYNALLALML